MRHEIHVEEDAPQNRHIFWRVERSERLELTVSIVNAEWPAIVFTRTKHGADRLAKQLNKSGVAAVAIHGDRSQSQRERALAAFTAGKAQALVATEKEANLSEAVKNLTVGLQKAPDVPVGWRFLARAHALKGDLPMAELATAEERFTLGNYKEAVIHATRAQERERRRGHLG